MITEGTMAYLLPALLEPLQQKPKKLSKDDLVNLACISFSSFGTLSCFFSSKLHSRKSVRCLLQPSRFSRRSGIMC